MEDEAQVLEGGRLGQHMLPNMPRARSHAVEDHNLRPGGADGEAKGKSCACHPGGSGALRKSKIAAQHHEHTPGRTPHECRWS